MHTERFWAVVTAVVHTLMAMAKDGWPHFVPIRFKGALRLCFTQRWVANIENEARLRHAQLGKPAHLFSYWTGPSAFPPFLVFAIKTVENVVFVVQLLQCGPTQGHRSNRARAQSCARPDARHSPSRNPESLNEYG
jgi:hypothetical protein